MNRPKFLLYPLGLLVLSAGMALAGTTTLTTYYPSPMGYYNQLYAQNVGIGTTVPSSAALTVMNGNVGIGVQTPSYMFQVGTSGSTSNGQIAIGKNNGAGGYRFMVLGYDNNFNFGLFDNGASSPQFGINYAAPANSLYINSFGNVGIGNTSPAANLDVSGLLHVSGNASPTTTAQGAYLGWNALTGGTGETDFINNQGGGTGGFAFMNTPSSGSPRTTIGEILPTFTELFNNSIEYAYFSPTITQFWNNSRGLFANLAYTDGSGNPYGLYANGTIGTSGSEPFWYAGVFTNTGGPYGLNTSNNTGTYVNLAIQNWGLSTNGAVYSISNQPIATGNFYNTNAGGYGLVAVDAAGTYADLAIHSGVIEYGLLTNGSIYASGTITHGSDQRLKKNILPLTGALDKIQRLNGVTFTWKKSGAKDIGVIAQNVEKVLPEIVKTDPDGMKGVEYGNMAALFIEAIKEQQKEIKDQQKEIEELEKKLGGRK